MNMCCILINSKHGFPISQTKTDITRYKINVRTSTITCPATRLSAYVSFLFCRTRANGRKFVLTIRCRPMRLDTTHRLPFSNSRQYHVSSPVHNISTHVLHNHLRALGLNLVKGEFRASNFWQYWLSGRCTICLRWNDADLGLNSQPRLLFWCCCFTGW